MQIYIPIEEIYLIKDPFILKTMPIDMYGTLESCFSFENLLSPDNDENSLSPNAHV